MQDSRNWSIYRQYKEDTDVVATWLADTAKRCGYPDNLRIPPSTAKSSVTPQQYQKNPQSWEEKHRNKQKRNRSQSSHSQQHQPKIGREDFINLARFIGEYIKCPARVPADFFTAIDRAIRLRKERISMCASFDDTSARHSHFLGILECVREILTPSDDTDPPYEATDRSSTAEDNAFADRLSGIEVQEPLEASRLAPDFSTKPPPNVTYETARHKDTQQPAFSFILLFQDYAKIRGVIIQTWMAYTRRLPFECGARYSQEHAGRQQAHSW
ncbi:hypothetical protein BDV10DRAFT_183557 [Aspergillus recurvatus]